MKARPVLGWLLVAACLALLHSSARADNNPPGVDSTHYWTYHVYPPVFYPQPIYVRDQFLPNYVTVSTDTLNRLVNWVYKNDGAVKDTFLHYTWWNIRDKLPVFKNVVLTNQFGKYPATVYRLEFMLTPALKNLVAPPLPYANHYLCYRAQGAPSPGLDYFLRDEWRNDIQHPLSLEYLCVPCWKQHAGQTYPPVDLETHLALYPIHPVSDIFYPFIRDQFLQGQRYVRQEPIEYLMVPSLKQEDPTDVKQGTWGKLKTLYR